MLNSPSHRPTVYMPFQLSKYLHNCGVTWVTEPAAGCVNVCHVLAIPVIFLQWLLSSPTVCFNSIFPREPMLPLICGKLQCYTYDYVQHTCTLYTYVRMYVHAYVHAYCIPYVRTYIWTRINMYSMYIHTNIMYMCTCSETSLIRTSDIQFPHFPR